MSAKYCHSCLKRGQHSPIYSPCYECREFHCKTCSDMHSTFKSTKDHNTYQLLLPAITPSANNENELASDFPKIHDRDPPYEAEVTVKDRKGKSQSKRAVLPSDKKSSRQADPGNLKAGHCRDIDVKRPEDKYVVNVSGVLPVHVVGKIVVVDNNNKMLKLFNDSGVYLSSTALKDYTWGITRVSDATFATCGNNTVYIWNIHDQTVTLSDITYHVDYRAYGIVYDGTYYCVVHRDINTITILNRKGRQVRQVTTEVFGKEIILGCDISMDSDSQSVFLPCCGDNSGVLCVSIQGKLLWFTPLSSDLRGITAIHGVLCVSDLTGNCLHLLSKSGKYESKLLVEKDHDGKPYYIYYDGQREKLYINFLTGKDDMISVYSVTC